MLGLRGWAGEQESSKCTSRGKGCLEVDKDTRVYSVRWVPKLGRIWTVQSIHIHPLFLLCNLIHHYLEGILRSWQPSSHTNEFSATFGTASSRLLREWTSADQLWWSASFCVHFWLRNSIDPWFFLWTWFCNWGCGSFSLVGGTVSWCAQLQPSHVLATKTWQSLLLESLQK